MFVPPDAGVPIFMDLLRAVGPTHLVRLVGGAVNPVRGLLPLTQDYLDAMPGLVSIPQCVRADGSSSLHSNPANGKVIQSNVYYFSVCGL